MLNEVIQNTSFLKIHPYFFIFMNKSNFIIMPFLFALLIAGCSQNKQQKDNQTTVANTDSEKTASGNTSAQIMNKQEVPVLCYHRISDGPKSEYKVSQSTFQAHMKILADSGYHSVSPAQVYDYLVFNKTLPIKPVMITFDDSRIEHFAIAAPILEKHGFRGVFFIMTITYNKKNYMTKEQIAQLAKAGHTIGLHSWDHTMTTKYKDAADWQKQAVEPKKKLEQIVGKPVEYWAYPNGVFNHKATEELRKYFKLSFSLSTKRDTIFPLQTIRRIIVPECSPQVLLKAMRNNFKRHEPKEPKSNSKSLKEIKNKTL